MCTKSLACLWLSYHFFPWKDPLAETHRLLVLVHFVIFLIHPLVESIGVDDPFSMHLRESQSLLRKRWKIVSGCITYNMKILHTVRLLKCVYFETVNLELIVIILPSMVSPNLVDPQHLHPHHLLIPMCHNCRMKQKLRKGDIYISSRLYVSLKTETCIIWTHKDGLFA